MIFNILADVTFQDILAWVILNVVLIAILSVVWMKFMPNIPEPMDLTSIKNKKNE